MNWLNEDGGAACANNRCTVPLNVDHVTLVTTGHVRRFCSVECVAEGHEAHMQQEFDAIAALNADVEDRPQREDAPMTRPGAPAPLKAVAGDVPRPRGERLYGRGDVYVLPGPDENPDGGGVYGDFHAPEAADIAITGGWVHIHLEAGWISVPMDRVLRISWAGAPHGWPAGRTDAVSDANPPAARP